MMLKQLQKRSADIIAYREKKGDKRYFMYILLHYFRVLVAIRDRKYSIIYQRDLELWAWASREGGGRGEEVGGLGGLQSSVKRV